VIIDHTFASSVFAKTPEYGDVLVK
jgi:hypothetical protein